MTDETAVATYRPDVDGLRAVAVLSVLLYHLHVWRFSGGFVGVDIFFVISGFLITQLIRKEIASGRFSFANFYKRRVRRLFPAMFFTIALSLVAASVLFPPERLAEFGASVIATILSGSNIQFWTLVSYFDTPALQKPLLHTWSLGVEEQFYLVWPLLLWLALKNVGRTAPLVVGVLGVASFALNVLFQHGVHSGFGWWPWLAARLQDGPSTIYYLTPFRIFELVIGAILVFLEWKPTRFWVAQLLTFTGIILIAFATLTYSSMTLFPTYNALVPCIGAVMIIQAGPCRGLGMIFTNPLSVGIGLISYSLYLVHWPLIVFYQYTKPEGLRPLDTIIVIASSIVLSTFMFFFIERPFRGQRVASSRTIEWRRFGFVAASLVAVTCAVAWSAWYSGGWLWRYPPEAAKGLSVTNSMSNRYVHARKDALDMDFAGNGKPKVLIVGDSMAGDFVNALVEAHLDEELDLRTTSWIAFPCLPLPTLSEQAMRSVIGAATDDCSSQLRNVRRVTETRSPEVVVLAGLWTQWSVREIAPTIRYFTGAGVGKVIVVGIKTTIDDPVRMLAHVAWTSPRIGDVTVAAQPRSITLNAQVKAATLAAEHADFLDPMEFLCPQAKCTIISKDLELLYFDLNHLRPLGALKFGQGIATKWKVGLFEDFRLQD
jgi:peptidoglycan/LPS O-acetylase OafA/YrhL